MFAYQKIFEVDNNSYLDNFLNMQFYSDLKMLFLIKVFLLIVVFVVVTLIAFVVIQKIKYSNFCSFNSTWHQFLL